MPNPKSAPFYITMHVSDNVAIVAIVAIVAATVEQVGWELFRLMLDVASGRKKTWAEQWKLHNALVLFNPAPVT
jgi:altronate dehydratase